MAKDQGDVVHHTFPIGPLRRAHFFDILQRKILQVIRSMSLRRASYQYRDNAKTAGDIECYFEALFLQVMNARRSSRPLF